MAGPRNRQRDSYRPIDMRLAALVLLVALAACGSSVDAPQVTCQNTVGSGVLEEDILGSWSFINNASSSTLTFLAEGELLVHLGTDEPGRDHEQYEGTWALEGSDSISARWQQVTVLYRFAVDDVGTWSVFRDGSDLGWSRCGI